MSRSARLTLAGVTVLAVGMSFGLHLAPSSAVAGTGPASLDSPPDAEPAPDAANTSGGEAGLACFPDGIASGAKIIAIGAYEGGLPVDLLATHEGHEVNAISVAAGEEGPALFLVLSAYDPVVWDLRQVPAGRLRGVLVTGYHAQAVTGAGSTPVRINTFSKPDARCGDAVYAYKGGPKLEQLDTSVAERFGHVIDRFIGGYKLETVPLDGSVTAGGAQNAIPLDGAIGAEAFSIGGEVDGRFGLDRLLAAGAIRRATRLDVAELNAVLTRNSSTGHLAPIRAAIHLGDAYVVLRSLKLPTGMFGAPSATFLVPAGVPMPADGSSHNTIWRLDTGECEGSGCGSE